MPRVVTKIPDTTESVTRPVALDILRQLGRILNLPASTQIVFPGAGDTSPQTGSTLGYVGEPSNFPYNGRLKIEVAEQYVEDRTLTDAVLQREFAPIFQDTALGVQIRPVYGATTMVMTINYRAESKTAVERFRDDIKMRSSAMRQENMHELTYHYGIPAAFLFLLQDIHTLREKVAGYGEDFSTWVTAHLTKRATNLTTQIGTQALLVVPEHQVQVWGMFDFTVTTDPAQRDGSNGGTWDVSFEYRVTYDKPLGCTVEYPLVIHNQLLDEKYYGPVIASGVNPADPNRRLRAPSRSRRDFDYFTNIYADHRTPLDGVRDPVFDDWIPDEILPQTNSLYTAMVAVDLNVPKFITNLGELGDWQIDPEILAWMRTEAAFLTHYGQSILNVQLYRNETPLASTTLWVDENLNVRSKVDLDPRARWHLRLAIVTDLFLLPNAAIDRFRSAGSVAAKLLLTLQGRLAKPIQPQLLGGKLVPRKQVDEIALAVNQTKGTYQSGVEYHLLTVGYFFVSANRSEMYANHETNSVDTAGG